MNKIALTLEVFDNHKREALLQDLSELLHDHQIVGGKISVTQEVKEGRRTKKRTTQIELKPGETFTLDEIMNDELPMERLIREAAALRADGVEVTAAGKTVRFA